MLFRLLEVCSTGISQCQSSVLQVLSLKAISGFAEYLQNKEANNTVDPYAKNIIL